MRKDSLAGAMAQLVQTGRSEFETRIYVKTIQTQDAMVHLYHVLTLRSQLKFTRLFPFPAIVTRAAVSMAERVSVG